MPKPKAKAGAPAPPTASATSSARKPSKSTGRKSSAPAGGKKAAASTNAKPKEQSGSSYRSHHCSELRAADIGKTTRLAGWVNSRRDHGGVIFIDLRDREGLTQVVFRPESHPQVAEAAHGLRSEDCIQIEGEVAARLEGTINPKLSTGEIEVVASQLKILSKADVVPFPLDAAGDDVSEDVRLSYRYLDLRRPRMLRNMKVRHAVTKTIRNYFDERGFLEIETPILSKSTPEGARDFLVAGHLQPGAFYALPQAPQQYKQLLMVGGIEKYFQIARCFRDEALRADRQPEFTQLDVEMSFVTQEDIYGMIEQLMAGIWKEVHGLDLPLPFPRMSWHEAMNRYGIDKPDTRFGLELVDFSETFRDSAFKVFKGAISGGGVVKAFNAKGFASVTTGQINRLTELAQSYGAKGLAYIKVEGGEWKSPIVKFFTDEEKAALTERLGVEEGDLILFGADSWHSVCDVLGKIRLDVAEMTGLPGDETKNRWDFLWVTEFPLLEYSEEDSRWAAVHHPFTRPLAEDMDKLEREDYANVRAAAYDLVLNGVELGGGSIRIHEQDLQRKMFGILGVSEEHQKELFGHLLRAFEFGVPPHGGIAFGLDRMVMLIAGAPHIRDTIAFPKNNRAVDLLMHSPAPAEEKQLRELGLKLLRPAGKDVASGGETSKKNA